MQSRPRKLLDQVRHTIRLKHYATSTEETYVSWLKRYILFHDKRHPRDMGIAEIEAFLTLCWLLDSSAASHDGFRVPFIRLCVISENHAASQ